MDWNGKSSGHVKVLAISPDGKKIVSASDNGTALVWDLAKLQQQPRVPRAQRLEEDWQTLTNADAEMAYHAMRSLEKTPEDTVTLFEERLKAVAAVAPQRLQKLVRELDSDKFETRDRATQELEKLGELAEATLQQTLTEKNSVEQRRRIETLLERLGGLEPDPERLRALRGGSAGMDWHPSDPGPPGASGSGGHDSTFDRGCPQGTGATASARILSRAVPHHILGRLETSRYVFGVCLSRTAVFPVNSFVGSACVFPAINPDG